MIAFRKVGVEAADISLFDTDDSDAPLLNWNPAADANAAMARTFDLLAEYYEARWTPDEGVQWLHLVGSLIEPASLLDFANDFLVELLAKRFLKKGPP